MPGMALEGVKFAAVAPGMALPPVPDVEDENHW
jgi:hypothetical protein